MATKKDLVEAYSFSRRRLVTAFVSGAPGGREVEPSRPGRTIVGGLALAVLLCAGAAIAGVFKPNVEVDWEQPGLILSKEKGAAYVILEPDEDGKHQVRPVINVTSAQLILGEDAEPKVVPQAVIDEETPGADIGILGAPVTVPDTADLIESGWTACTDDDHGIRFAVSAAPDVDPAADRGLLVKNGGTRYVIAHSEPDGEGLTRAYRYELPDVPGVDNLLGDLDLPIKDNATAVPTEWLDLFPAGGPLTLESFGIVGYGPPSPDAGRGGLPGRARLGDYYEIDGRLTVLTEDGPAVLSEFARAVYLQIRPAKAKDLGLSEPADVAQADPPYDGAHWPAGSLGTISGEQCAQLVTAPGELPRAVLVELPGETASAEEVEAGDREVTVDPGGGAFVLSGGWHDPEVGEPFVMDAKGFSYALIGTDAVENLGFGGYDAPVVPDSWLHLFEEGEELSVDAALCPPVRPSRNDAAEGDGEDGEETEQGGGQAQSCE
jgi:type VII secretion protein EccB